MNVIVNVSEDWGIGLQDRLLFRISADLRRFRELTAGKTVVLGRKTLATFPNGKPLKNRKNIVLTHDASFFAEDALVVHDLKELLTALKAENLENVCVIGGASIYEQLLAYCSHASVTKTFGKKEADRFFPNLDRLPNWKIETQSEIFEEDGIRFQYIDYVNQSPKML